MACKRKVASKFRGHLEKLDIVDIKKNKVASKRLAKKIRTTLLASSGILEAVIVILMQKLLVDKLKNR